MSVGRPELANIAEDAPDQLLSQRELELMFNHLYRLISTGCPIQAQHYISDLSTGVQKQVVNYGDGGRPSLFFRACTVSAHTLIEWMLHECSPDLEQMASFQFGQPTVSPRIYNVTPLWFAAAFGEFEVVRLLVSFGANVNTIASNGFTPIQNACHGCHSEIVQYLVAHGANLHIKTNNGETCLMNSINSLEIVRLMLHHGVSLNAADVEGNTALHRAVIGGQTRVAKHLVETGANLNAVNVLGETPLLTAAECKHTEIMELIVLAVSPSPNQVINAYLIITARMILDHDNEVDRSLGVSYWRRALAMSNIIRRKPTTIPAPKRPRRKTEGDQTSKEHGNESSRGRLPDYSSYVNQWKSYSVLQRKIGQANIETVEDLSRIENNRDALREQALLMYEKSRGSYHDNFIQLLLSEGCVCSNLYDYTRAVMYFAIAYEIQMRQIFIEKQLIFKPCVRENVVLLVQCLFETAQQQTDASYNETKIDEPQFAEIIGHMCDHIRIGQGNICKELDIVLVGCVLVVIFYQKLYPPGEQSSEFWKHIRDLNRYKPRDSQGKSILHLCLDIKSLNSIFKEFYHNPGSFHEPFEWDSRPLLKMFLLLGADPYSQDVTGNTVLHAAIKSYGLGPVYGSVDSDVLLELLKLGVHPDQVNKQGQAPIEHLPVEADVVKMDIQKRVTLQCLAARVIAKHNIPYVNEIPRKLYRFVELHAQN